VAYLAVAYVRSGNKVEGKALLDELTKRSELQEKGVNIYIVHVLLAMDDMNAAKNWLAKAKVTNDVDLIWLNIDPLLKDIRHTAEESAGDSSPDFAGAENHINNLLETAMPSLPITTYIIFKMYCRQHCELQQLNK
jgi:hypothetical protein